MHTLDVILAESAKRHKHLCPRQVLGARMGLLAAELLGLDLPRRDKRLLVISETDGCAVDGLIAATGCRVGSRTLRILDVGKVAATFTDTSTETTFRIAPKSEARSIAAEHAPAARNQWEAMLLGYQVMPVADLFAVQPVRLNTPLSQLLSRPGKKAICEVCSEEIINGREVLINGAILCRSCSGGGYYQITNEELSLMV
jgi:formylmethanofuran dehydrogenase subunit E